MTLIFESDNINDYKKEIPGIIQFDTPLIRNKVSEITSKDKTKFEKASIAFQIARDEIRHSFDIESRTVSITGEDALKSGEGICFVKSHLLATLLRAMDIACGFCYQRVLRKGTIESGYGLHGLNAIFLQEYGWFRVDPRGNKQGIDSQFTVEYEQLAYPIREELGEIDYPNVFIKPLDSVIEALRMSKDSQELFYKRPENI